jgi:hypothetical protein
MPWRIQEDHPDCPSDRPYAVVKEDDGEVEGCHETREKAEEQQRALYANEEAAMSSTVTITTRDNKTREQKFDPLPWRGPIAVEGVLARDDGLLPRVLLPDSLTWAELPLPLMALRKTTVQHQEAEYAGKIETIERDASRIPAAGHFDASEFGHETARLVGEKALNGVSVDLAATTWSVVLRDGFERIPDEEVDLEALFDGKYALGLVSGQIAAATIVPVQALEAATISLVASSFTESTLILPLEFVLEAPPPALVAAAPLVRPGPWFAVPEPDTPTPFTVLESGQCFGHPALWDSCHTGFVGRCIRPERSRSNYAHFHLGAVMTEEGDEVSVGQITLDTGHAPTTPGMPLANVRRHYDDTGTAVADVRVTDGRFGPWACGALRAVPDGDVRKLKAAKLSGDWRKIDGRLELIGLLAVNVPGFPVPRPQAALVASAAGDEEEVVALVAAGILDVEDEREALLSILLEEPTELEALAADMLA